MIVLWSALALSMIAPMQAPAAPNALEISASLTPGELTYGMALVVSGRVMNAGDGLQGAPLALQADPYPFRSFVTVAHLTTTADGSFTFSGIKPNRNTRLRVIDEDPPGARSASLPVIVDPRAATSAVDVGRGRSRLSLRVEHTRDGGSPPVSARWFLAARGTSVFHLVAVTTTRELYAGVTYASATVDPPSKLFSYRVCFNPTWERAMGAPFSHRPCPEHDDAEERDAG